MGGTGASTAAGALTALGLTATAAELNYTKGVTSAIQTQLNAKPGYNYIVNPCFEINQEGKTSVNIASAYPVDQWFQYFVGSSMVSSQQAFTPGQTDVPGEPKNYLRAVVTSSAGADNVGVINQRIESVRTLAGRNAVLSFYAKADAVKPIAIEFNQVFGSGGSSALLGVTKLKLTLSTGWTKYTVPVTFPSITGKTIRSGDFVGVSFWLDAGSNFNSSTDSLGQQSGTFEFANVKLEEGTVATPCVVPRFDDELRKCMRFWESSWPYGVAPGTSGHGYGAVLGSTYADNNDWAALCTRFVVPKRGTPTVTLYCLHTPAAGKVTLNVNTTLTGVSVESSEVSNVGIGSINGIGLFTTKGVIRAHYVANARL
jgi:hypothetical protein